ncbi:MAG TPA: IPTL-CTERM sorting domain-containing protein [Thermoanaerobaculia bacterium]
MNLGRGWIALVASLVFVSPVAAAIAPPLLAKPKLDLMIDARVNSIESFRRATAARAGAAKSGLTESRRTVAAIAARVVELKRTLPGLEVQLSNLTGGPETVLNKRGALTGAAAGRSEDIVRSFLDKNSSLYGLSAADLGDLVALGDSPGGASGLRMLRMEQQIDGRPVFQSETRFILDREGRLVKTTGLMVPNARLAAPQVKTAKLMAPADAVVRLLAANGETARAESFTIDPQVAASQKTGGRITLEETDDFVAGPITARQVLFPLAPGLLVPAWSLVVFTSGDQDWYAVVDAETGDVLWQKGIRDYASAHDARFRVYVQADGTTPADSPAPQSPNMVTPGSGTQFPEIAPTIVSMHTAYDPVASQNGWINDCPAGGCTANETQTLGNNTLVCMDAVGGVNANVCDTAAAFVIDGNGRPTGNPDANARNRDFLGTAPRDFQTGFLPPPQAGNPEAGQTSTGNGNNGTLAIDQYRRGMLTDMFYMVNWYHDRLFKLGFDEASANFQQTNFSGMGLGNDRVLGDAQDNSGTNNANFATPPDGTSGRAQMFRFTGPTIDRDGGIDAEILLHELTHGTSNRLVGNGAGLNWNPARGMGEGWSDFYALSLLNNANADNPNGQYAEGGWATYKFAGFAYLDNYLYGIRRFPYSTNHSINPETWADVDDVTNNLSGGIAPDPLGFNLNGGMEVHNIGEIWALTLWGVRARVIGDPAGANGDVPTGNHTMLQLTTDALKMTPVNPSFIDARDAFFQADCATNACANEGSLWAGFADRGLGYGAKAPYRVNGRYVGAHEGIGESFSVPYLDVVNPLADVMIDDSAANNNGVIDPGEPIKLTIKLTNPWRGAGKAVAGATATLSTTTPGITIYDNSATYGAIAPQGTATGDTFLITVATSVPCGSAIDFTLTTVSSLGTTATTFKVRVGNRNGTDPAVTYTGTPAPALTIADNRPRGVFHQINVTDDFEIADINFRVDSVNHPAVADLTVMLRSPGGIGNDLVSLIDGLTDCAGNTVTNMVIDDDLPRVAANDMVQATTADAPFSRSWLPVYNSPWAALVDPARPAEVTGDLTRYDGTSTKGTWSALVADVFSAATGGCPAGAGTFNAWSIIVTPVHFDCVAFAPSASLTATKTVAGSFQVGGTVTYTVTLTNNGTGAQGDNAGHEFTDTLPAGLTLVSATATSGTAATAANTATWDGTLAPLGGSVTITITATVNAGAQNTTISNQGSVSYDSNNDGVNDATLLTDDPAVGGATDPTSFAVLYALVTATKSVSGTFKVGGTVTYTIVLSNSGTGASPDNPGNELTDVLPAGLTLVSASATSGTAATNVPTRTVTWNGGIAAGGSVTITITATVNTGTQGMTLANQASFAYDADLNGTNESSGTSDDPSVGGTNDPTSFMIGIAQVVATKTVSGTFKVGGTVTYTIVLSNTGSTATTDNPGNELTDVLPAGLTLVSATATSGTATATIPTRTVTWNGGIAAGGSVTITVTATVNTGTQGTTLANQATFAYDADVNGTNESSGVSDDPTVGGASDPTSFTVGNAVLSATKTASGTFVTNSTVTYTIVISNSGNSASLDNVGHEFTDTLPAQLTLVSASATSGTATTSGNTVNWDGTVPAAGSVTITITATIKPGFALTPVSNQGSVSYDSDLNGTNETTVLTDDPAVGGTSDPTTFRVVPAAIAEVPTLSEWGLMLLGFGLLLAAWTQLRRRAAKA